MENMEEIYHFLEDFSKRKPKVIPQELNDYLAYVARTGDPVYQWSLVKSLFKEKLLNVITDFYETTPTIEIPPYPNVDPFNYDTMKNSLLERLDSFPSAPFTVQRICELLTFPRKQYNRVDKFMRAVEKNILVVSTREPGMQQRHIEQENGEPAEPIVNGSDNNSDYNVDVEMEDMSWKENADQKIAEPQPSSSDTHISVDDIEARLNTKQDSPMQGQEKANTEYESVTPPELNVTTDEQEIQPTDASTTMTTSPSEAAPITQITEKMEETTVPLEEIKPTEPKTDVEMKNVVTEKDPLIIPEIKVDDAEMTEQRLAEESNSKVEQAKETPVEAVIEEAEKIIPAAPVEEKPEVEEAQPATTTPEPAATLDETTSDTNMKEEKEEAESKTISEVLTSSEESSSSSDNTDCNSNSPKLELQSDSQESSSDANQADSSSDAETKPDPPQETNLVGDTVIEATKIETDNYSISDVKSELPQPKEEPQEVSKDIPETKEEVKEEIKAEEENKTETVETPGET